MNKAQWNPLNWAYSIQSEQYVSVEVPPFFFFERYKWSKELQEETVAQSEVKRNENRVRCAAQKGTCRSFGSFQGAYGAPLVWHLSKNKLINPISSTGINTDINNASDLHCHVIAGCGYALQPLVVAAAGASRQHHAGRKEDVFDFLGILLYDLHQKFPRFTQAFVVNLY